ncbi:Subtilisin-like protease 1 [Holothuria leucospilota]|uniref:Subtilisin-like protease 1 n=1 Tax=Holothuria leucospilota TaxID=206669 RepID=A0A9Q0YQZ4_HOLLE|nr:Subtilisin-like protease 1 [Holothuria leucospilota]
MTATSLLLVLLLFAAVSSKPLVRPNQLRNGSDRSFIVKFKDDSDVDLSCGAMTRHFRDFKMNTKVRHSFKRVFRGASLDNVSPSTMQWLMTQDYIESIEEVTYFRTALSVGPEPDPITMVDGNYLNWGLDRITEVTYTSGDYEYNPSGTGKNTNIFIVDTGVRLTHLEFSGRADFMNVNNDPMESNDCEGHGTQTSGVAVGTWRGTATQAYIVSVKVLGCDGVGTSDSVLSGLEAILTAQPEGNAVVSMSITSDSPSESVHEAIANLVDAGFVVVAAAGNLGDDACFYYPAAYPEVVVITVGAINAKGKLASFSNFGPCVDIYAPGANIYTATNEGDDQIKSLKGTSFAAPFVSGAAAILLEQSVLPKDIKTTIIQTATTSVSIGNLPAGSHNRILHIDSKET